MKLVLGKFFAYFVDMIPVILTVCGALVIAGWSTHSPWLVKLNSEESLWPPMSQWTALCFFLLGFFSIGDRAKKFSHYTAFFIYIISLIFLVERIFGFDVFCFDQFFADKWAYERYALLHGRMAEGTSLCFIIASYCMLSMKKSRKELAGSAILGIIGLHILNFGTTEPFKNLENPLSHMATNSAILFLLWGMFLTYGSKEDSQCPSR
jgi:hypothetical protein